MPQCNCICWVFEPLLKLRFPWITVTIWVLDIVEEQELFITDTQPSPQSCNGLVLIVLHALLPIHVERVSHQELWYLPIIIYLIL